MGSVEDHAYNFYLSTFQATTDASGNLVIDLTSSGSYQILAGTTVTVSGPSGSPDRGALRGRIENPSYGESGPAGLGDGLKIHPTGRADPRA